MKFPTLLSIVFAALVTMGAAIPHDLFPASTRHARIARLAQSNDTETDNLTKRCLKRSNNNHPSSHNAAHAGSSIISVGSTPGCGPTDATAHTTKTSGPNGNINWLNCGVDGSGWNPPHARVQDLISQDLKSAIKERNSPFKACSAYENLFEKYGRKYGIPAILLASFAMQESTCNRNSVGGGGEQGIMQISKDKCGGAPNGDCKDPDFNIDTAAKYFSSLLKDNGGNVLLSIGSYNGWFKGMTYEQATSAARGSCCRCQQNLDYIHQFVNGWLQNTNAEGLGKYFNLKICLSL